MAIKARKLKDGSTVYDVCVYTGFTFDGKRDRKTVTCKTKRAAQLEEARLKSKTEAMRRRSGRMSLASYIETRYWPIARGRLQPSSLDTYQQTIRKHILPNLGHIDLEAIDRAKIQSMVDGIETEAAARKAVNTLKTILGEAVGDGLIATNPATAKFAYPPKGSKRDNGLVLTSFEQIGACLDIVAHRASESVQRIAYTGLLQGLRPEERYALDWSDLDVENRTISVSKAYTAASSVHGGNSLKAPKTELSTRVIPMHPKFAEWLETQERTDGAFILGANGQRISPSTAQKRWRAFLRENPDCPQVTIENMRHSFATSYLAAGGRIETLSLMLGHSTINTTLRRYIKPDIESLKADISRIFIC